MPALPAIGAIAGIVGAGAAIKNGNAQTKAMQQSLQDSKTQLNPFNLMGPGGQQASYNGNGISSFNAGDLEGLRAALSQYATGSVPGIGSGVPQGVTNASNAVTGAAGQQIDFGLSGLSNLEGLVGNQFNNAQNLYGSALPSALSGLSQQFNTGASGAYQNPLQNTAFMGAAQQAQQAGMGFQDVANSTLANLRAQAQPVEQQQQNALQQNQFSTGRLGTTGGALQTEAFARGLGQADLSRQLAAQSEARTTQQNALGLSQGLTNTGLSLANFGLGQETQRFGAGMQQADLGQNLLGQAFNNFSTSAGLASDLNNQRFSRSAYGQSNQFGQQQQLLSNQIGQASLPSQLQGADLQNILAALQGQSGINTQAQQLYGVGLSTEQAAANARIGSGSNMANIVGSPAFASAGYGPASALSQLASSFAPAGGYASALQGLFGGGGTKSTGNSITVGGN